MQAIGACLRRRRILGASPDGLAEPAASATAGRSRAGAGRRRLGVDGPRGAGPPAPRLYRGIPPPRRRHRPCAPGPTARWRSPTWNGRGATAQTVIVPWTVIEDARLRRRLRGRPCRGTADAGFAAPRSPARLLSPRRVRGQRLPGLRRVIDVSGDGPDNAGAPVEPARECRARGRHRHQRPADAAQGAGLLGHRRQELAAYYRDCVIGGPGAFVIPVTDRSSCGSDPAQAGAGDRGSAATVASSGRASGRAGSHGDARDWRAACAGCGNVSPEPESGLARPAWPGSPRHRRRERLGQIRQRRCCSSSRPVDAASGRTRNRPRRPSFEAIGDRR